MIKWQYALSDHMLKPASNPAYYENIVKEFEQAPKRSWLGRVLNRWKGVFRLRK